MDYCNIDLCMMEWNLWKHKLCSTNKGALHILILQKFYPLMMVMIELEQNNEIVNSLKQSKCDRYITYVLSGHVTSGQ